VAGRYARRPSGVGAAAAAADGSAAGGSVDPWAFTEEEAAYRSDDEADDAAFCAGRRELEALVLANAAECVEITIYIVSRRLSLMTAGTFGIGTGREPPS